jgi:L-iditol 2-dehydrogenase
VASLVTNLGCALYGYEALGGYVAGANILVIGPGPLGLAAVAAGKALGANRVLLSGTRAARMSIGGQVGADRLISASEEDPYAVVMQETGGIGVDFAIEVSGSQAGLDLAIKSLKRNGKMLLLGIPHHPVPIDLKDLSLNDKDIIAIRGEGRANVGRAVSLLANGRVNIAPLVTHTFPLAQFEEAYRTFNERIGGAMKVILKPQP